MPKRKNPKTEEMEHLVKGVWKSVDKAVPTKKKKMGKVKSGKVKQVKKK